MTGTDELWQGYAENGLKTRGVTKIECRTGVYHAVAHVWLWRTTDVGIEIMIQKRSSNVLTWPGLYDASAAGHVDYGEEPIDTALRELHEELGFKLDTDHLYFLFASRFDEYGSPEIRENELRWVYGLKWRDEYELNADDHEVHSVQWLPLDTFESLVNSDASSDFVPNGKLYFDTLLYEINRIEQQSTLA